MPQEKTILAIFDFDGTLTTGHLWSGISKHHHEYRVKRAAVYLYVISHMPFWLAAKIKLYSQEKNRMKWGKDLSVLFKGFTREEGQRAFEWVTDRYFLPLMRPDVMAVLKEHRQKGHKIMILSGMFSDFLQVVAQRIGADYAVGTRLETVKGRYSGRIVPPLCFGENKAVCLSAYIAEKGLNVDFDNSSAYADSIYDSPVLRLVGTPVAVYPDKQLAEMARSRKWRTIGVDITSAGT
jgi:HAD superfamily hydrolase (TIGR01490 family)